MRLTVASLRKPAKLLHELGSIGVTGSFAAIIVLFTTAPKQSLDTFAVVNQSIATLAKYLLVPSLALVVISGLVAMMLNSGYLEAAWVWVKALLGISMFEGTLLTVVASARRAAELSALAAAAKQIEPAELAQVVRTEAGGLWLLSALCLLNIALAVWRPKFDLTVPTVPQ